MTWAFVTAIALLVGLPAWYHDKGVLVVVGILLCIWCLEIDRSRR